MGVVYVTAKVTGPTDEWRSRRFLVDSGAAYSPLPMEVWRAVGQNSLSRMIFTLADSSLIEREVSECSFEFRGIQCPLTVILGERDDPALLGTVTLENMGLVLNPIKRTLQPMQMILA